MSLNSGTSVIRTFCNEMLLTSSTAFNRTILGYFRFLPSNAPRIICMCKLSRELPTAILNSSVSQSCKANRTLPNEMEKLLSQECSGSTSGARSITASSGTWSNEWILYHQPVHHSTSIPFASALRRYSVSVGSAEFESPSECAIMASECPSVFMHHRNPL